jgi:hypothetical protein
MSGQRERELIGIIEKQIQRMDALYASITEAFDRDVALLGRTSNAGVMIAGLFENYYTCIETAFQKISQHFENHLEPGRWHAELLSKMTLRIEGLRIPAVSETNYPALLELQRFRHFKRYYFDLDYDWDRLDFLRKKLEPAHPMAVVDLRNFIEFLRALTSGT